MRRLTGSKEVSHQLMMVALGEAEADLAIVNGDIVNVYTGEVTSGDTVLVKGDYIAYVGKNASRSIGSGTEVIDAGGKVLIPGLIDGHTHANYIYSISEMMKYALKGGTTTVITEAIDFGVNLGYRGIIDFLKSIKRQPMKIFVAVPPLSAISPLVKDRNLTRKELHQLLKRKEVIGLGECYWGPTIEGDKQILDYITDVMDYGKKIDGHTTGARGNKLQGYASLGISSCHEPTTIEEILERLRLGMFVLIREGETRRELEAVAGIKDENIDFRQIGLNTDGVGPWQITTDGYMDFVVQKAIDLGFNPVRAVQMATVNIAQHFGLDDFMGGIAPGKCADVVIIPNLKTIRAECVISNGRVVARDGQLLVQPRNNRFPGYTRNIVHLPRELTADDFTVCVDSKCHKVKVRVIDQITELVTKEAVLELPVADGSVLPDIDSDILKVAAIERTYLPGKTFVGFIKGLGFKRGAMATTAVWDASDIIVAGTNEGDMAQAVNRIVELKGGIAVCEEGKILAEMALPISGMLSAQPVETISRQLTRIQQAAESLGCILPDVRLTLCILTTGAIPFLRMCEEGLVDLRQNRFVDLIVD